MRHLLLLAGAVLAGIAVFPGVAAAQSAVEVTGIRLGAIDDGAGSGFTGGGELFVDVRGSTDGPKAIHGMLLGVGAACPAEWSNDAERELRMYDGNGYVRDSFVTQMLSPAVALRQWRVCMFLVDENVFPPVTVATADRVVDPQVAPQTDGRPTVAVTGLARRTRVTCNPGVWAAWPKPSVRYAWKVNGRRVRGARRSVFRVRPGARVACGVTVRNAVGTKTAWSRARRA